MADIDNVYFNIKSERHSFYQALLSLGDRRVAPAIEAAERNGGNWRAAVAETGVDADFFVFRDRIGRHGAAVGHHRRRHEGPLLPLRVREGASRGVDASAKAAEGERTAADGSAVTLSPSHVRRPIARLLVVVATTALVLFVIVTITGGFLVRLGPLRLSAHNWRVPLLVAIAAAVAAARFGRGTRVEAAEAVWSFVDRHAAAFAVVLAAATAGIGVGFGTYSASSSDASGYVSEAALIASARLASDEPLARAVAWRNAAWTFSPLGYRPGADPGELVPTYPAGLPLVMTPFRLVGGELAAYLVVPLLGAVAVLATYFLGACLHSRYAGLIAAALLATSPIVLFQIVQPMSDVPAAAWWTIALLFALSPVSTAPLAAGGAAGLAILTRPNLLALAIVIAFAAMNFPPMPQLTEPQSPNQTRLPIDRRPRPDRLLGFAAGLTPAIGGLLLMQWRLYGNPLVSGYGTAADLFSLSNIGPNLVGYSRRLIEGETPALLVSIAAMVVLIMTRRGTSAAPPLKRPLVLATLALAIVVFSYLPYAVFAEWSYLRFLLPAFPLLFIAIGGAAYRSVAATAGVDSRAAVAVHARGSRRRSTSWVPNASRRSTCAATNRATDWQAGTSPRALPPKAVIVAVQESGGARYYTHASRPSMGLARRRSRHRCRRAAGAWAGIPCFVVEDWERSEVAQETSAFRQRPARLAATRRVRRRNARVSLRSARPHRSATLARGPRALDGSSSAPATTARRLSLRTPRTPRESIRAGDPARSHRPKQDAAARSCDARR